MSADSLLVKELPVRPVPRPALRVAFPFVILTPLVNPLCWSPQLEDAAREHLKTCPQFRHVCAMSSRGFLVDLHSSSGADLHLLLSPRTARPVHHEITKVRDPWVVCGNQSSEFGPQPICSFLWLLFAWVGGHRS